MRIEELFLDAKDCYGNIYKEDGKYCMKCGAAGDCKAVSETNKQKKQEEKELAKRRD